MLLCQRGREGNFTWAGINQMYWSQWRWGIEGVHPQTGRGGGVGGPPPPPPPPMFALFMIKCTFPSFFCPTPTSKVPAALITVVIGWTKPSPCITKDDGKYSPYWVGVNLTPIIAHLEPPRCEWILEHPRILFWEWLALPQKTRQQRCQKTHVIQNTKHGRQRRLQNNCSFNIFLIQSSIHSDSDNPRCQSWLWAPQHRYTIWSNHKV